MRLLPRICALLLGVSVLFAGCSQSVSSSSSSMPSAPVSSSSPSSEAPQSSSQPVGGIDPEFTISEAIRPTPWWQELIEGDLSALPQAQLKLYDNTRRISVTVGQELFSRDGLTTDLSLISDSARKSSETSLGDTLDEIAFFEILTSEDIKFTGYLFENGIALTRSIPGQETTDPIYLLLSDEDYVLILERMQKALSGSTAYPSWLALMRLSRCESITGHTSAEEARTLAKDDAKCTELFKMLQTVSIKTNSVKVVPPDTRLTNGRTLQIGFDNDIQYRIQTDGTSLIVASSDMGTALRYTLASGGKALYQAFLADDWVPADNPMTA